MNLRNAGMDWKDRRFIFNLYKNQATIVDVNGHKEEAEIRQRVRQERPLSPYLFNLFIEEDINEMIKTTQMATL